jgi:hypothetical protein
MTPPPKRRAVVYFATASIASSTESQARRSLSTSHTSGARKQDAPAWASGSPSLDGGLRNGSTFHRIVLSQIFKTKMLGPSAFFYSISGGLLGRLIRR